MTLDDIIKKAGGVSQLAREIGFSRQAIHNWKAKRNPPRGDAYIALVKYSDNQFDPRTL